MRPLVLVALALVPALASCSGSSKAAAPQAPNTVLAANFAFTPDTITIHAGTTVTWVINQPDAFHNVVSLSGPTSFNSGVPKGRGTFKFTFSQVGTYTYDCQIHPNMKGTVTVIP